MMDCKDFLAGYSAFRDGDVTWEEREAFEEHVDLCAACARYDRVVGGGVSLFRDLPELEVSDDFAERLQHRLYHVDEERSFAGRRASAGAAVATFSIAAMIAAAAWVPLVQPSSRPSQLPGVAVRAPAPAADAGAATQLNLIEELANAGVRVRDFPYHEVVFHGSGSTAASLALYEPAAEPQP